ncbi:MAG: hypothetical protein EBY01_05445 [Actinobacteria bacterium]|nr:hypothetical protein [Actinomycetota bacterium]
MGSGLIYIIIVGMWIAYFLPRWIANHDEVSGRSVDKFNEAMRVVGKASGKSKVDLEELLKRKENQMLVRRIVFFSILGLMTICALFILVGFLSPTIILLPLSALGIYLVNTRHQISYINDEIEFARQNPEGKREDSKYSDLIIRSKRVAKERAESQTEQWVPLSERLAKSEGEVSGITIIPKGSRGTSNTWDPISVPPPSYTKSPKAVPNRGTHRKDQEIFSEEDLEVLSRPAPDEIFDQQAADLVEEQIRTDRAANE